MEKTNKKIIRCPNCDSSFIYIRIDKTIVCRRCGQITNAKEVKGGK